MMLSVTANQIARMALTSRDVVAREGVIVICNITISNCNII